MIALTKKAVVKTICVISTEVIIFSYAMIVRKQERKWYHLLTENINDNNNKNLKNKRNYKRKGFLLSEAATGGVL